MAAVVLSLGPRVSGGVAAMKKIDFKKEFGHLYLPGAKDVVLVDVPAMQFAMVDGVGNPNGSPDYIQALEALFGVSYTLKFMLKHAGVADYKAGPLESLWWTEDDGGFSIDAKDEWKWTSLIMQPDVVRRKDFEDAASQLREKKDPPALTKVRFERWREGTVAQIMYIGPYSAERPTIERVHAFIRESGYRLSGKHHEIYLGDPRRSAPEKLKTVIRQPARH